MTRETDVFTAFCTSQAMPKLIANAVDEAEAAFEAADNTRADHPRTKACHEARGFAMLFLAHYLSDELQG